MPVNTKHNDYLDASLQWERCRDCANGTDAVKTKQGKYLPKLDGQSNDEYLAYLGRALFYGATGRTVQGLLGAVFRKDHVVRYPFPDQLASITSDGLDDWEFARRIVREVLTVGRVGALVDMEPNGERAYVAIYTAESIINWRMDKINGKLMLSMLVLEEDYEAPKVDDPFVVEKKKQYRVCRLVPGTTGLIYIQEVYREIEKGKTSIEGQYAKVDDMTVVPKRRGVPLTEIPFRFFNTHHLTPEITKPPLLDLVDINLSHYKTSADLEHGAHFTALPTAWIAGFPTDKQFKIGSTVAWVSKETDAKAGFLEFKGQGLNTLISMKDDKEKLMAVLGARMLEHQKKVGEAAETLSIRQSGESGALSTIVRTTSEGIADLLKLVAWWSDATDAEVQSVIFELNTDFTSDRLEADQIRVLMEVWQRGAISQDTFLYNLKEGEILPKGRTIDDEKDLIAIENPTVPGQFSDFGASGGRGNTANGNVVPIKREWELTTDDNGKPKGIKEV